MGCDKDRLKAGLCSPPLFLRPGLQPSCLQVSLVSCSSGLFLLLGEAQILSDGRVLSLPTARLQDSGTYTCVASSAVGEDRREAALEVWCKYACASSAPSTERLWGWMRCLGLWGCSVVPLQVRGVMGDQPWGGRVPEGWLREGVTLSICFPVPLAAMGEEENVSVIINKPVTLECTAPGVSPQGSRWLKDGILLTPKPGMQLSVEGTVLQVMFQSIAEDGRGNGAVKNSCLHLPTPGRCPSSHLSS